MAVTTPGVAKGWAPDQVTPFKFEDVLGEALYSSLTKKGGEILGDAPSLRVPYVTDSDDAEFYAEGATISESSPSLDEVTIQSRKLARLVEVSNEAASQGDTPTVIANSVRRDLVRKLDLALLVQVAPTAPAVAPSVGLLNTPGILEGEDVVDNLDPLIDVISEIGSGGGKATTLLLSPTAWAHLYKMKRGTAAGNVGLLSAATDNPDTPILGLQVRVTNALPDYTGMAIDPEAIVSAWSPISVAQSTDAAFRNDSTLYRATVRCGHVVVKPNRIAKLAIGEA